jgi:hypothetical protein
MSDPAHNETAASRWDRYREPYRYLQNYIKSKGKRHYQLTYIDLVLASNFKGGRGAITEPWDSLQSKLPIFSTLLEDISDAFGARMIPDLSPQEKKDWALKGCKFLSQTKETDIKGFKASYSSALLNAYFPDLYPIIDKWVLRGVSFKVRSFPKVEFEKEDDQVIDIEKYYRPHLNYYWTRVRRNRMQEGIMERIDRELFSYRIPTPKKKKAKR